MKVSEIREMSREEMQAQLLTLKETLFNLRFQHAIGQLENPTKIKMTKRDVARINTILNEARTVKTRLRK